MSGQSAASAWRRWRTLLGGVVALLLCGVGEALVQMQATPSVRSAVSPHLSLLLYLLGIGLFTVTAWGMPRHDAELPDTSPPPEPGPARWRWWVLAGGLALSIAATAYAGTLVRKDLRSATAAVLWIGAMVILVATGAALHRQFSWPARWGHCSWPKTIRARRISLLAGAAILVVAALARFVAVDTVPLGLNADEGDRAGLSIQLMRGTVNRGLFDYGWYRIHMVYFNLLALWMQVFGMGYVPARWLNGLSGALGVAVLTWMGVRNWGVRVGLLGGALASVLAVYLQFSRITTEAGPTGLLWLISLACFLEAARRGRVWGWLIAGLCGGLGMYFYPSSRLWAIFAAGWCGYLLLVGLGGRRGRRLEILGGSVLAAIGAVVATIPFWALALQAPEVLALRAQETSIFSGNNATRLAYYRPDMSMAQLLIEQLNRSFGVLNQYGDRGGVWPTEHQIMTSAPLAVLTILGIGWVCLRWRDPRSVALGAFFWVGLAGIIVTVETPNLHRMATAIPVLALFPVLALDNLARRVDWVGEPAGQPAAAPHRRAATSGLAALAVGGLMVAEANYYFVDYASQDRWWYATTQGIAVHDEGPETIVIGIGRFFHYVNSGWVRLLAYDVPRGELRWPGGELPLPLPPEHDQSFMVFPRQGAYIPYLRELFPAATTRSRTHPTEGLQFTMVRVPRAQLAAKQGATAWLPNGSPVKVEALGAPPPGLTSYPARVRWTAGLRAPRYWNYAFQVGPGPARLTIDGYVALELPAGAGAQSAVVALARGTHAISYEGTIVAAGESAVFRWAEQADGADVGPARDAPPQWKTPATHELMADVSQPRGLLGTIKVGSRAEQLRVDDALVGCCFTQQVRGDQPFTATWTGTLTAPVDGNYAMTLLAMGVSDLVIDGQRIIHSDQERDEPAKGDVRLTAGPHQVEITARFADGPSDMEWAWTVPGRELSIVPPSALAPPPGSTAGPAVPQAKLGGRREAQPAIEPFTYAR